MRIVATGSYCCEVSGEPPPLKSLARETTGTAPRRAGRFVHLALVGAGRCVDGSAPPPETATYVTSCRGDLETTLSVLEQMFVHGHAPAPFDFINTVGNSACFHVAKSFGLSGRTQFVTRRYAPLEAALSLAALDMEHAGVTTALVGSVDMCTAPIEAHRLRIGVRPGTPVGEGSHWFLLSACAGDDRALGVFRAVRSFPDETELLGHLGALGIDPEDAVIAGGPHLGAGKLERFSEATGIRDVFDYGCDLPWYDSRTGHGIHRFLTAPIARTMVHLEGDPGGRFSLLVIEKTPPGATGPKRRPHGRHNGR